MNKPPGSTIAVKELTDFDWDTMYVFWGAVGTYAIEHGWGEYALSWAYSLNSLKESDTRSSLVTFSKNGRTVHAFSFSGSLRIGRNKSPEFPKEEAVIRISDDGDLIDLVRASKLRAGG
jgi:hypothetical protein